MDPCHEGDHRRGTYTPEQQALLDRIAALNRRLQQAMEDGTDIRPVLRSIDPDPARYMWVDEGGGRLAEMLAQAEELLGRLPGIAGHRRLGGRTVEASADAARPAVAVDRDGRRLVAWIEWAEGTGERVVAALLGPGGEPLASPEPVSGAPADCFRPTATFDATGTPWIFYAKAAGDGVAVFARRWTGAAWTPEERVSQGAHPAFNQEAVGHPDGSLECSWQGRVEGRFAILARRWERGAWGPTRELTREGDNAWDPTLVAMPDGTTAYAWSEYDGRSYRTVVRTGPEAAPAYRTLTSGDEYSLHPSLAVTTDGTLWCAYDLVTIQGHGSSGPTRLRSSEEIGGAWASGMLEAGMYLPAELVPDVTVGIRVVRIDGWGVREPAGELAPGLDLGASALPRLAATGDGGLVVAYRVLRRMPLMTYYWEVAAQVLGPGGWSPPVTFSGSDAGLEEVSLASDGDGAVLAWQADGRAERVATWSEGFGGWECSHLREHYGEAIWHGLHSTGRVRLGRVTGEGAAAASLPAAPSREPAVVRPEARRWAEAPRERYVTEVGGAEYGLYWGDLHRHSLISRCTAGDEPSLEDFYRYSWDVCEYDFWAVSDHAENSTAYQWWCIQKIADLFRVDGRFVPLYGFEWTASTGHQNVIYGTTKRGAPLFSSLADDSATPADLWRHLRRFPEFPAITIPHHPGSAMVPFDWDYGDPDLMRLVEVFQACRGNYEDDGAFRQFADATLPGTFVLDGLRRGYRFGLIASSDHGNGASYVGAYAEGLDRASVFAALQARRTIAATTRGIALDVRIGDTFMGGELVAEGPVELEARVEAYADLARIEVVRNGRTVHEITPSLDAPAGWLAVPLRVEFGWGMGTTDWSGTLEIDGGCVLQTPYWSPEIVEVGEQRIRWSAVTKSLGEPYGVQRGAVELTLLGPADAVVRVRTAAGRADAVLGMLAERTVHGIVRGDGVLRLERGVGGLSSLGGRTHRFRWTDDVPGDAWYYVRAYLVDGEMAWSSPIWVDRPAS